MPVTMIGSGHGGEQDEVPVLKGLMVQCERQAPKQIKPWGKKEQHRPVCHGNMEEEATIFATEIRKSYKEERRSDLCLKECLLGRKGVRVFSPKKQPI